MKSIQEKYREADSIVREIESYFMVQSKYFQDSSSGNLERLRVQPAKIKSKIKKYKGK